MAPIHIFLAFREGYLEMKEQISEFRVHGLISSACATQIELVLDERFQDFMSVFANDGVAGQWIRVREWWFHRMPSLLGGRPTKYRDGAHSKEMVARERDGHRKRLHSILGVGSGDEDSLSLLPDGTDQTNEVVVRRQEEAVLAVQSPARP